MAVRTKRISAGAYAVSTSIRAGGYVVNVNYFEHLRGWVAAACWDRHLYTDQLPTKRQAVREAQRMIDAALKADAHRMIANAHLVLDRLNEVARHAD